MSDSSEEDDARPFDAGLSVGCYARLSVDPPLILPGRSLGRHRRGCPRAGPWLCDGRLDDECGGGGRLPTHSARGSRCYIRRLPAGTGSLTAPSDEYIHHKHDQP